MLGLDEKEQRAMDKMRQIVLQDKERKVKKVGKVMEELLREVSDEDGVLARWIIHILSQQLTISKALSCSPMANLEVSTFVVEASFLAGRAYERSLEGVER